MKSLIRHPLRIGLAAVLLATAASANAASAHPAGLAVNSTGNRALIRVAGSHGKPLLVSVIRTAAPDRSRLESMTTVTYTRQCTTDHGVTSMDLGTFRTGVRVDIQRDPHRHDALVFTVHRATLTGMRITQIEGCQVEHPTVVRRTVSFVATPRGGQGAAHGAGGFRAQVVRLARTSTTTRLQPPIGD